MPVIHIPSHGNNEQMTQINDHVHSGKPAFVLLHMDSCGPCRQTRPEWMKLEDKYSSHPDIGIFDVEMAQIEHINHPELKEVSGFPTMRYIKNNQCEDYESCSSIRPDRSYDSFLKWIESKEGKLKLKGGKVKRKYKRKTFSKKKSKKGKRKTKKRKTRRAKRK